MSQCPRNTIRSPCSLGVQSSNCTLCEKRHSDLPSVSLSGRAQCLPHCRLAETLPEKMSAVHPCSGILLIQKKEWTSNVSMLQHAWAVNTLCWAKGARPKWTNIARFHLQEVSQHSHTDKTGTRMVVARGCGQRVMGSYCLMATELVSRTMKTFLRWMDGGDGHTRRECAHCHWINYTFKNG